MGRWCAVAPPLVTISVFVYISTAGSLIVVGSTNFIVNECEHAHSGKITMLAWNETGTRLFSGDAVRDSAAANTLTPF